MLVLSRKVLQTINIGDDIVITIVSINGNQVKVGIDAPSEVVIMRPDAKIKTKK